MDRSRILLIILVLVGLGGGVYEFYDRYQENVRKKAAIAEAQRKAAEAAEKKARQAAEKQAAEEKRIAAEKEAAAAAARTQAAVAATRPEAAPGTPKEADVPIPTEVTIGTPKIAPSATAIKATVATPGGRPLMEPPPPADKPVPVIPAAEGWIRGNQLTSTLMGTPRLAVISRREYQIGQRVPLPGGLGMNLKQIEDGFVVFESDGFHFKMRLKTVN